MMMYNRHNDFVGVMYENKVINTIIIKSNSNSSCGFANCLTVYVATLYVCFLFYVCFLIFVIFKIFGNYRPS